MKSNINLLTFISNSVMFSLSILMSSWYSFSVRVSSTNVSEAILFLQMFCCVFNLPRHVSSSCFSWSRDSIIHLGTHNKAIMHHLNKCFGTGQKEICVWGVGSTCCGGTCSHASHHFPLWNRVCPQISQAFGNFNEQNTLNLNKKSIIWSIV